MIYLDTSVALAHLLAEDRAPPEALWREPLISSRLLEYELFTRLHGRGLGTSHAVEASELLGHVAFVELTAPVVARAREPFPAPVRTLDALHLASADFLREQGVTLDMASYDTRMLRASEAMGFGIYELVDPGVTRQDRR